MTEFVSKTVLPHLPLILLLVALLVGGIWIYRVWHEAHGETDDAVTPDELMEQFREAHEAGELDDEEFRRVRALLKTSGARSRGLWDDEVDRIAAKARAKARGEAPPVPAVEEPAPAPPPIEEPDTAG